MFSINSYAKIKTSEDKGNYSVCKISISKKNKQSGKYENTFIGDVRFIGNAHLQKPMVGQKIKITNCGVSNCYTKNDKLEFCKVPNYVIFGYELQDTSISNNPQDLINIENLENDLPF